MMCIAWKVRQHKLGIDDFGNPLRPEFPPSSWSEPYPAEPEHGDRVPGLVGDAAENPATSRVALVSPVEVDGQTPLLAKRPGDQLKTERIWSKWFSKHYLQPNNGTDRLGRANVANMA